MRAHLACSISRFIQCILIIWEIMNAEGLMEGGRGAEKGTLTEEGRERLREEGRERLKEEGREGLREETSKSVPLCNRPLGHIVSGARPETEWRSSNTYTRSDCITMSHACIRIFRTESASCRVSTHTNYARAHTLHTKHTPQYNCTVYATQSKYASKQEAQRWTPQYGPHSVGNDHKPHPPS